MNTRTRSYRWLLWTLALVGLAVDQGSKYGVFLWLFDGDVPAEVGAVTRRSGNRVFRWLYAGDRYQVQGDGECDVWPGVFKLLAQFQGGRDAPGGWRGRLSAWGGHVPPKVNHGALFGLGGGYVGVANGLFAAVSVLAAGAILYWSRRKTTARDPALCAALGLIFAGTVGNLYDRLIFNGVRDFLYFYWFEWPVFNIADCCLVCGAALLLLQALFHSSAPAEASRKSTAPPSPLARAS